MLCKKKVIDGKSGWKGENDCGLRNQPRIVRDFYMSIVIVLIVVVER